MSNVQKAIESIFNNNLNEMKENFAAALYEKAAEKLEERKIEIASSLLNNTQE